MKPGSMTLGMESACRCCMLESCIRPSCLSFFSWVPIGLHVVVSLVGADWSIVEVEGRSAFHDR